MRWGDTQSWPAFMPGSLPFVPFLSFLFLSGPPALGEAGHHREHTQAALPRGPRGGGPQASCHQQHQHTWYVHEPWRKQILQLQFLSSAEGHIKTL